ncbi:hypothetical protein ACI0FR_01513 [Paenochrobactrum sp. BZR 201-1]
MSDFIGWLMIYSVFAFIMVLVVVFPFVFWLVE